MQDLTLICNEENLNYTGDKIGKGDLGLIQASYFSQHAIIFLDKDSIKIDYKSKDNIGRADRLKSLSTLTKLENKDEIERLLKINDNASYVYEQYLDNKDRKDCELINKPTNIDTVNKADLKFILGVIERERLPLYKKDIIVDTSYLLCRELKKDGINYIEYRYNHVLDNYEINRVEIEEVIENPSLYSNIKINNEYIVIKGLDGEYKYNIDKIHAIYKRRKKKTASCNKAKLLGKNRTEIVNERGDLLKLSTDEEVVILSTDVRNILEYAIELNHNNKSIAIGENILNINKNSIIVKDISNRYNHLEVLYINCKEETSLKVIKAMDNNFITHIDKVVFNRQITSNELLELAFGRVYSKIDFKKEYNISDEMLIDFINKSMDKYLDMGIFTMKDKVQVDYIGREKIVYVNNRYEIFKENYRLLKHAWKKVVITDNIYINTTVKQILSRLYSLLADYEEQVNRLIDKLQRGV